jgi:hypothetical protein
MVVIGSSSTPQGGASTPEMKLRTAAVLLVAWMALPFAVLGADGCGQVVSLETHSGTTTRYTLSKASGPEPAGHAALVLLAGGTGYLNLDDRGCAQMLKGNSLVRSIPIFNELGFATALVDAPSDHSGGDGLAAFRTSPRHAEDLGKIIADVRARTKGSVWLIGTSRGAISAANAASRLAGASVPDGLVLTSAVTSGDSRAKRVGAAHSVFDVPLEDIRMPLLVIGHESDTCLRSPASLMGNIIKRTKAARRQVVLVTGGPGGSGLSSIEACEGHSPHGFLEQEREVATGIGRFIRDGKY